MSVETRRQLIINWRTMHYASTSRDGPGSAKSQWQHTSWPKTKSVNLLRISRNWLTTGEQCGRSNTGLYNADAFPGLHAPRYRSQFPLCHGELLIYPRKWTPMIFRPRAASFRSTKLCDCVRVKFQVENWTRWRVMVPGERIATVCSGFKGER